MTQNDISWDGNRGVKISWKHRKSFTKKKKKWLFLVLVAKPRVSCKKLINGIRVVVLCDNLGRGNTCFRIRCTRSWPCHVATAEELEAKEKS